MAKTTTEVGEFIKKKKKSFWHIVQVQHIKHVKLLSSSLGKNK